MSNFTNIKTLVAVAVISISACVTAAEAATSTPMPPPPPSYAVLQVENYNGGSNVSWYVKDENTTNCSEPLHESRKKCYIESENHEDKATFVQGTNSCTVAFNEYTGITNISNSGMYCFATDHPNENWATVVIWTSNNK